MTPSSGPREVTDDAALGGRLRLFQPRRGHRFGHDAMLLAAAAGAAPGDRIADFGAGVGAAGLALAVRVPGSRLTLVEHDAALVVLAEENIRRNGLADRIRAVALDVASPAAAFAAAGLAPNAFEGVIMNPPFNDPVRLPPAPDPARAGAHAAGPDTLAVWCRAARRLLAASGRLTLIWQAEGLADVLAVLARGFGGVAVLPVHPRPGAPAIRVLVGAVKGSRAPLRLLPGLVLAETDGRPSALAERVLRDAAPLPLGVST
ncbi:MAG TPA: methyltransferase [Xanthobacteraceae bacterium]|nr:methyltransferase [Xanthobacteraceae bacterium]